MCVSGAGRSSGPLPSPYLGSPKRCDSTLLISSLTLPLHRLSPPCLRSPPPPPTPFQSFQAADLESQLSSASHVGSTDHVANLMTVLQRWRAQARELATQVAAKREQAAGLERDLDEAGYQASLATTRAHALLDESDVQHTVGGGREEGRGVSGVALSTVQNGRCTQLRSYDGLKTFLNEMSNLVRLDIYNYRYNFPNRSTFWK